jgi:hypothetical protein
MTKGPPIIVCRGIGCNWRGPPPNSRHPQCPMCHKFFDVPNNRGILQAKYTNSLRKGKKR